MGIRLSGAECTPDMIPTREEVPERTSGGGSFPAILRPRRRGRGTTRGSATCPQGPDGFQRRRVSSRVRRTSWESAESNPRRCCCRRLLCASLVNAATPTRGRPGTPVTERLARSRSDGAPGGGWWRSPHPPDIWPALAEGTEARRSVRVSWLTWASRSAGVALPLRGCGELSLTGGRFCGRVHQCLRRRNTPKRATYPNRVTRSWSSCREFPNEPCASMALRHAAEERRARRMPRSASAIRKFHKVKNRPAWIAIRAGSTAPNSPGRLSQVVSSLHLCSLRASDHEHSRRNLCRKQLERELGVTYKTAWRMST